MVRAKSVATTMPFLWIASEADDKAAEHFLKATKGTCSLLSQLILISVSYGILYMLVGHEGG